MAHKLKIEVEDVYQHPDYIRVNDWSEYDKRIDVTNRVLKVNVPGAEGYSIVPLPKGSGYTYTAKSLKLAGEVCQLSDGLWRFVYSVAPNDKIFTEVFHFRTVILEQNFYSLLSCRLSKQSLSDEGCSSELLLINRSMLMLKSLKATQIDAINASAAYKMYKNIETLIANLSNVYA